MDNKTSQRMYVVFGRHIDLRHLKEPIVIYLCGFMSLVLHAVATILTSDDRGRMSLFCAYLAVVLLVSVWYSTKPMNGSGIRYLSYSSLVVLSLVVAVHWSGVRHLLTVIPYLGAALFVAESYVERAQTVQQSEGLESHAEEKLPLSM